MTHITDGDRQGLADDTLDAQRAAAATAHLAVCAACAGDVARLHSLVRRLRDAPAPRWPDGAATAHELWPAIRARIQAHTVVEFPVAAAPPRRAIVSLGHRRAGWIAAGVAAAAAAAVVLLQGRSRPPTTTAGTPPPARTAGRAESPMLPASDSGRAYQQRVQQLLDEIEMQRAMLGPGTAPIADSDLRVIDQAIAELREALLRDPNNAALRQLLATSYQQKLDLLKRLSNAS